MSAEQMTMTIPTGKPKDDREKGRNLCNFNSIIFTIRISYDFRVFLILQLTYLLNRASLAVSPKMEATQMEIFNFLWLTWDH